MNLRLFIKNLAAVILYYTGLFKIVMMFNNILGRKVTVLLFHRISDGNISSIKNSLPYLFTSRESFEKQIMILKKYYNITTFKQLWEHTKEKRKIKNNTLVVTFDDGYRDNYTNGYNILKKNNVPAVIFICPEKIDCDKMKIFWWDYFYSYFSHKKDNVKPIDFYSKLNRWETKEINSIIEKIDMEETMEKDTRYYNKLLDWEIIAKMKGLIEFGSHTNNHINLVAADWELRKSEIKESKKLIEKKIKQEVVSFSYPAGIYNEEVKKEVAEEGYRYALTTQKGINSLKNPFEMKRITLWEGSCLNQNGKFSKSIFMMHCIGL